MANSSSVSSGDLATADQYNNLRDDVLSTSSGHLHDGSAGRGDGAFVLTVAGVPITIENSTDATSNQVMIIRGNNSTRADGDEVYVSFMMDDDGGNSHEFARITAEAVDVSNGSEDGQLRFGVSVGGTMTDVFKVDTTTGGATAITFEQDSFTIKGEEGGAGVLYLFADQGDDAGDEWKINVADGGVLTIGNDIASAGSYVTHLTITPNSTVANSSLSIPGVVELGHASDTTIARSGSGDITIEGNAVYRAGGTDVPVTDGGTGASSLTDGGVLLGSGTNAVTAMAVLADGEMIVGDGTTDPVAESGATLRDSIGVGTGDSPQFTGIELSHASQNTLTASSGVLSIEGNRIFHAGGDDVPVADGGTGASSLTDGGILLGSGTSAVTAMAVLADGEIVVGDGSTDPVALAAFSSSTGALKVANGGTGATSLTDKAVLISQDSGTDTVGSVALTTSGQIIIGGSSGPQAATLTAGSNITITNGDGSISIAASGSGGGVPNPFFFA